MGGRVEGSTEGKADGTWETPGSVGGGLLVKIGEGLVAGAGSLGLVEGATETDGARDELVPPSV